MASFPAWVRAFLGDKTEHPRGPHSQGSVTRRVEPVSLREPVSLNVEHNEFALALHKELREIRRNLFFSPFSIRMALAMTYAGARGETASQMKRALCFGSSDEAVQRHIADITHKFSARNRTGDVSMANALWSQEGAPLCPEFVDLVARHYGGSLNTLDFGQPEAARATINGWVEHETKGRIPELLRQGSLTDETRLVLANAVYFKGTWELKFKATETRDEPFYLEDGVTVSVPVMHQRKQFRYVEEQGFQAVNLDFQGGDVSMIVLLPDTKDGLWNLEARVTAPMLHECLPRMFAHDVRLSLPRFKMACGIDNVVCALQARGMVMPFDPLTADFSGINGLRAPAEDALFISTVVHKAFVELNEDGAEAAAATAGTVAGCAAGAPRAVTFRADHPFLFAIRDTRSGAILFLGRVADPTAES